MLVITMSYWSQHCVIWIIISWFCFMPHIHGDPYLDITLKRARPDFDNIAPGQVSGQSYTITCTAIGFTTNPQKFEWSESLPGSCGILDKALENDVMGRRYSQRIIGMLRKYHSKTCTCAVKGDTVPVKESVKYDVIYQPAITAPQEGDIVTANVGGTVELFCEIEAKPRADISWTTSTGIRISQSGNVENLDGFKQRATLTLKHITKKYAGKYFCWAMNDAASLGSRRTIILKVNYPPPNINLTMTPENGKDGSTANLRCWVSDSEPRLSQFEWRGECGVLDHTGLKPDSGGWSQERTVILNRDFDNTVCECIGMYNGSFAITASIVHNVEFSPNIVYPPNATVLNPAEGSEISMNCIVKARPYATVTWNSKIPVNGSKCQPQNRTICVSTLTISDIKKKDNGAYTCIADNQIDPQIERSYILEIRYKPMSVELTGPTDVSENDVVNLKCEVGESNPLPISISLVGTCGTISRDSKEATMTMEREYDKKKCTCFVHHELGNLSSTLEFNVTYAPEFIEPVKMLTNITTSIGKTVNMTCKTKSNPPSNIIWTYHDLNMTRHKNASTVFRDNEATSLLGVLKVTTNDSGRYVCSASNGIGLRAIRQFRVTVKGKTNETVEDPGDDDIRLLAIATSILGVCLLIIIILIAIFVHRYRKKKHMENGSVSYSVETLTRDTQTPQFEKPGYVSTGVGDDSDDQKVLDNLDTSIFEEKINESMEQHMNFGFELPDGFESTSNFTRTDDESDYSDSVPPDYDGALPPMRKAAKRRVRKRSSSVPHNPKDVSDDESMARSMENLYASDLLRLKKTSILSPVSPYYTMGNQGHPIDYNLPIYSKSLNRPRPPLNMSNIPESNAYMDSLHRPFAGSIKNMRETHENGSKMHSLDRLYNPTLNRNAGKLTPNGLRPQ